jgi:hypothetical protein
VNTVQTDVSPHALAQAPGTTLRQMLCAVEGCMQGVEAAVWRPLCFSGFGVARFAWSQNLH